MYFRGLHQNSFVLQQSQRKIAKFRTDAYMNNLIAFYVSK